MRRLFLLTCQSPKRENASSYTTDRACNSASSAQQLAAKVGTHGVIVGGKSNVDDIWSILLEIVRDADSRREDPVILVGASPWASNTPTSSAFLDGGVLDEAFGRCGCLDGIDKPISDP